MIKKILIYVIVLFGLLSIAGCKQEDKSFYEQWKEEPEDINPTVYDLDPSVWDVAPVVHKVSSYNVGVVNPSLKWGQYQWFSFNVDTIYEKCYITIVQNSYFPEAEDKDEYGNVTADIFYKVVNGYSNEGRITAHEEVFIEPNSKQKGHILTFVPTQTQCYVRVRGEQYRGIKEAIIVKIRSIPPQNDAHVHSYVEEYSWSSATKHIAYCLCGMTKLEYHVVQPGTSICSLCGGPANKGLMYYSKN